MKHKNTKSKLLTQHKKHKERRYKEWALAIKNTKKRRWSTKYTDCCYLYNTMAIILPFLVLAQ